MDYHGMSGTTEYRAWNQMIQRCDNPKCLAYPLYGGRGISVCDRWRKFIYFFEDIGPKPSPELTLERIDNEGDYEPGNVKWDTPQSQSRNKRLRRNNKSGYAGISLKKNGLYLVRIYVERKEIRIGLFLTLEDAIEARRLAEIVYWSGER